MQQFGTWGDHVTLQAVADTFGVHIAIMTSYQDSCVVEIKPQGQTHSQRVLYLSFWAEVKSILCAIMLSFEKKQGAHGLRQAHKLS